MSSEAYDRIVNSLNDLVQIGDLYQWEYIENNDNVVEIGVQLETENQDGQIEIQKAVLTDNGSSLCLVIENGSQCIDIDDWYGEDKSTDDIWNELYQAIQDYSYE